MTVYKNLIATPPGETIKDELDFLKLSQKDFSLKMGMTEKTISQIINGKAPISYETAIKLETVLQIPSKTWLNLETNYRETLARIKELSNIDDEYMICNKLPYKELIKKKWIPNNTNKIELIHNLRKFYGIASLKYFEKTEYEILNYYKKINLEIAFKKTLNKEFSIYTMITWIRKAEIEATKLTTNEFDNEKIKKNINDIKNLSNYNCKKSIDDLKKICASCGIALVIVPHLKKTYVDGMSKWLNKNTVLISLSNRGKSLDKFYFNFFHELGHIFLHKKKHLYINANETSNIDDEKEANNFAKKTLIPKKTYLEICNSDITEELIIKYSKNLNIHPSIIVGRLQYDKIIPFSKFNKFKEDLIY